MSYNLLRDPSQDKLHYETMRLLLNLMIRGYVQDMKLGVRDQRTVVSNVIPEASDIDYIIKMDNVPDFEAQMLEYSPTVGSQQGAWYEVKLVPFDSWSQHFDQPRPVASFYGSLALPDGVKAKFNFNVTNSLFRLSYRMPLLAVLQMGDTPPLPGEFAPMLAYDLAVRAMSVCKDGSQEWREWVKENEPKYIAYITRETARWIAYLEESAEPAIQDVRPFNSYRMGGGSRSTRGYVPRQ